MRPWPGWQARSRRSRVGWAPALRATRPCGKPLTATASSGPASATAGASSPRPASPRLTPPAPALTTCAPVELCVRHWHDFGADVGREPREVAIIERRRVAVHDGAGVDGGPARAGRVGVLVEIAEHVPEFVSRDGAGVHRVPRGHVSSCGSDAHLDRPVLVRRGPLDVEGERACGLSSLPARPPVVPGAL